MKIIIVIIMLIFFSMTADADNVHITYVSLVDPNLGFYKVTDSTTHEPAPYVGRVLTINQGDSIVWRNDADPSSSVTIVSEQNLFPDAELKLINDVFSYTFNQAGIYSFYIKEREMAKQTIIVNGVGTENTPVATPNNVVTPNKVTSTSTDITSSNNDNGTINESSNIENYTENNTENNTNYTENAENYTNGSNNNDKNNSNLSVISIASIMVAIISILMMFNTRKR